jgi:hypothetical protein
MNQQTINDTQKRSIILTQVDLMSDKKIGKLFDQLSADHYEGVKLRALKFLLSELESSSDSDNAYDCVTMISMELEAMTRNGIKSQADKIAHVAKVISDLSNS